MDACHIRNTVNVGLLDLWSLFHFANSDMLSTVIEDLRVSEYAWELHVFQILAKLLLERVEEKRQLNAHYTRELPLCSERGNLSFARRSSSLHS